MYRIRRADERGHADHGWLNSYHTFSFADYYDPAHMGFRSLRSMMNEDRVAPGQGFGTHGHHDMEIISYVLSGALEHRDSLGNGEVLTPGEFQRMSAGTGVRHSEFNPSATEPAHFYQIWLLPSQQGVAPSYEQQRYPTDEMRGRYRLVASPTGENGSLKIHQNARVYLATLAESQALDYTLAAGRLAWLQVLRGSVNFMARVENNPTLQAGDGLAVSEEASLAIIGATSAEVMLFDLA